MDFNVNGIMYVFKYVVWELVCGGGGLFVGIFLIVVSNIYCWFGVYGVIKLVVDYMMKLVVDEFGLLWVWVNSICLGLICIDLVVFVIELLELSVDYWVCMLLLWVGEVEDVVNLVMFLFSDVVSWIIG